MFQIFDNLPLGFSSFLIKIPARKYLLFYVEVLEGFLGEGLCISERLAADYSSLSFKLLDQRELSRKSFPVNNVPPVLPDRVQQGYSKGHQRNSSILLTLRLHEKLLCEGEGEGGSIGIECSFGIIRATRLYAGCQVPARPTESECKHGSQEATFL